MVEVPVMIGIGKALTTPDSHLNFQPTNKEKKNAP